MFRFPVSSGLGLWVSEGFGFRVRVSGFRAWGLEVSEGCYIKLLEASFFLKPKTVQKKSSHDYGGRWGFYWFLTGFGRVLSTYL